MMFLLLNSLTVCVLGAAGKNSLVTDQSDYIQDILCETKDDI